MLVAAAGVAAALSGSAASADYHGRIAFVGASDVRDIWSIYPDGSKRTFVAFVSDFGFNDNSIANLTWSPDGKWLAFTSVYDPEADPPADLYLTDGSTVRKLTNTGSGSYTTGTVTSVNWSPDGSHLLFVATDSNGWGTPSGISEIAADGTGERIVVPGQQFQALAWGADGRIAYSTSQGVFIAKRDGSSPHKISSTPLYDMHWSPDETRLVGDIDSGGSTSVAVMNADGSDLHVVAPGDDAPTWSPDGKQLVFMDGYTITIADADGTNRHTIADPATGQPVVGRFPAWSVGNPLPAPNPPTVAGRPSISGVPKEGDTLSASGGTWNGDPPMTIAYAWQRCDASGANCSFIDGATASQYTIAAADVGHTLRVDVTASNLAGTGSSGSDATGVVAPANAPPTFAHAHARRVGATIHFALTVCDDNATPVRVAATETTVAKGKTVGSRRVTWSIEGSAGCREAQEAWRIPRRTGTRQVISLIAHDVQGAASSTVRLSLR